MARLAHHFEAGGWGMWPLLACSTVWLTLTIERALVLYAPRSQLEVLLAALATSLHRGDVSEAIGTASRARGPIGRMALVALRECLQRESRIEGAIAERVVLELAPLHRRIRSIGSIASIATLFGLFGTITGLATPFGYVDEVSRATRLARGISESMGCTAGGLFVAICAMSTAELFRIRAGYLDAEVQLGARAIVNLLVTYRARLRWNGERAACDTPLGYRDEVPRRAA